MIDVRKDDWIYISSTNLRGKDTRFLKYSYSVLASGINARVLLTKVLFNHNTMRISGSWLNLDL